MSRLSISVVGIGAFVLFVLFSFATAISISNVGNEAAANPKQQHCEPIKIPLCKGMRYTLTTMPNHFGQATQEIAIVDLAQYQALANVNCSSELQLFLCSMYTPICIKDYTNDIPVCRAVCERVKAGCFPVMDKYNFPWPDRFDCDRLPAVSTDEQLCMDPQEQQGQAPEEGSHMLNKVAGDMGGIFGDRGVNRQGGGGGGVIAIEEQELKDYPKQRGRGEKQQCSCKKCQNGYGSNPLVSIHPEDFLSNKSVFFGGIPDCVMSCRSPYFDPDEEKEHKLEAVLTFLTVLCLLSSIFTVLGFLVTVEKYNYPERPILYFGICYVMVGLGFSLRLIFGHEAIACEQRYSPLLVRQYFSPQHNLFFHDSGPSSPGGPVLSASSLSSRATTSSDSTGPALCTLSFLCVYSFGMAAAMWWVMLTLTWFLSAAFHWVPEAITKYKYWIHGVCWGTPLAETLIIMILSGIDGDNVSGLCLVGAINHTNLIVFFLLPLFLKLGFGIVCLFSGVIGVLKLRPMIDAEQMVKIQRLMYKIIAFSLVYVLPMLIVMMCFIYDIVYRSDWEEGVVCLDCLPEDQPQPKPSFDVYILKFSMFLVPGIPTILWVLNGKLVEALVRRGNQMFGLFQGGAKQQRIRGSRSSGGGGGHEGGEEEDSHQGEEDTQQSQQLNPSGQGAAGAAASGGASAGAESHYEDINQSSYEKTMKSTDRLLV